MSQLRALVRLICASSNIYNVLALRHEDDTSLTSSQPWKQTINHFNFPRYIRLVLAFFTISLRARGAVM